MSLTIFEADYHHPAHAAAIVYLLNHYAEDTMGGGQSLPSEVVDCLVGELALRPFALTLLAYRGDTAVGLINAFEGFSTFACKPLLNIHDIVVHRAHRRCGIATAMLEAMEQIGRRRGCCKLTLEVLAHNAPAKAVYRAEGFAPYSLRGEMDGAEFWQKPL